MAEGFVDFDELLFELALDFVRGFVEALAVEGVVYGLALGVRFVLSPAQFDYEDLQRADYDDDGLVPAGA